MFPSHDRGGDRQFIRADNGRSSPILIQAGSVSGDTGTSGNLSVTFPEAFSSGGTVLQVFAQFIGNGNTYCTVYNASTTGCLIRFRDGGGALIQNTTVAADWIAYGPKSNI